MRLHWQMPASWWYALVTVLGVLLFLPTWTRLASIWLAWEQVMAHGLPTALIYLYLLFRHPPRLPAGEPAGRRFHPVGAQNLTRENLEDIRMLTGMESMGGPSMRVILLGQPELKAAVTAIPQLSQRVKLFFHLEGLTLAETSEYIDYRLLVSGHGGNKLFDEETVREIHNLSKGIPRLINKLCDGMMMCAYAEDRPFIDPHDLKSIRKDLLGEDSSGSAPRTGSRKKAEAATPASRPSGATADLAAATGALVRIAEALERIDARLDRVFPDDRTPQKGSVTPVDNVKPLSPSRK
jgi:general secretion pathway protein A